MSFQLSPDQAKVNRGRCRRSTRKGEKHHMHKNHRSTNEQRSLGQIMVHVLASTIIR